MKKKIAVLGSTGSIGTQALDIIKRNMDRFVITALSCGENIPLFEKQLDFFSPRLISVRHENDAERLQRHYPKVDVLWGENGLTTIAEHADYDILLNGLSGILGMMPTYAAINAGKDIALANKESLVAGGEQIMKKAREKNVVIFPVDSEHSAIFQALEGNRHQRIRRILLTASGGPFRSFTPEQLETVKPEQALKHPNWVMGSKISIDSATMMNKGLEVIEARWLFDVDPDRIEVLIHKESIVHSMVEYEDHSIIAQLGMPDMRMPIAYAFTWPERLQNDIPEVDFTALKSLTFEAPDMKTFRCLSLAYDALRAGGSYPVVLNAANEVMVRYYLERKVSFPDIPNAVEHMLKEHAPIYGCDLETVLAIDNEVRERLRRWD